MAARTQKMSNLAHFWDWEGTVPFHSIWQALLCVTGLPKFWFWHLGRNHCDIIFFSACHPIFFQILESLAGQILVQVVGFLVRTGRE